LREPICLLVRRPEEKVYRQTKRPGAGWSLSPSSEPETGHRPREQGKVLWNDSE